MIFFSGFRNIYHFFRQIQASLWLSRLPAACRRAVPEEVFPIGNRHDSPLLIGAEHFHSPVPQAVHHFRMGMSVRIAFPAADDGIGGIYCLQKIFRRGRIAAMVPRLIDVRGDIKPLF